MKYLKILFGLFWVVSFFLLYIDFLFRYDGYEFIPIILFFLWISFLNIFFDEYIKIQSFNIQKIVIHNFSLWFFIKKIISIITLWIIGWSLFIYFLSLWEVSDHIFISFIFSMISIGVYIATIDIKFFRILLLLLFIFLLFLCWYILSYFWWEDEYAVFLVIPPMLFIILIIVILSNIIKICSHKSNWVLDIPNRIKIYERVILFLFSLSAIISTIIVFSWFRSIDIFDESLQILFLIMTLVLMCIYFIFETIIYLTFKKRK